MTTGEAVAKSGATPNSELSMDIAKPAEGEMTASIILFPQDMPEKVLLEVRMNDETYTQYMPVQNLESGHAYPYNVTFENPAMTITKAEIEDWIVEDDKDVLLRLLNKRLTRIQKKNDMKRNELWLGCLLAVAGFFGACTNVVEDESQNNKYPMELMAEKSAITFTRSIGEKTEWDGGELVSLYDGFSQKLI